MTCTRLLCLGSSFVPSFLSTSFSTLLFHFSVFPYNTIQKHLFKYNTIQSCYNIIRSVNDYPTMSLQFFSSFSYFDLIHKPVISFLVFPLKTIMIVTHIHKKIRVQSYYYIIWPVHDYYVLAVLLFFSSLDLILKPAVSFFHILILHHIDTHIHKNNTTQSN